METNNNSANSQNEKEANNSNKEYPGYAPEPANDSGNSDHSADDRRVAEKAPIRNANYHERDGKKYSVSNYSRQDSDAAAAKDEKTLEDYNDTNPKRDINQQKDSDKNNDAIH
jgi:hypothetical protein